MIIPHNSPHLTRDVRAHPITHRAHIAHDRANDVFRGISRENSPVVDVVDE